VEQLKIINVAEVAQKKGDAIAKNAANEKLRQSVVDTKITLTKMNDDLTRLREAVRVKEQQIAILTTAFEDTKKRADAVINEDVGQYDKIINEAEASNKATNAKKNAHLDHLRMTKQRQTIEAQINMKKAASDELTEKLEAVAKKKAEALAAITMPVKGLTVDGDAVFYNGVPFNQVSTSEQIRIGLAMSMASNPKLRVVLIRNGDMIQDKKMAVIAEWAEENDVLVLMERRETKGAVGVVLEEGKVRDDKPTAMAARMEAEGEVGAGLPSNGEIVEDNGNINIPAEKPPSVDDEIERMMADMQ
jgi:hypothetical protein